MPAMVIPMLIMAGTSVAGSAIAARASGKAAKVQQDGEAKALALQQQQYQDAQARYAPYTQMGQDALPTLRGLAGNVQAPRYGTNLADLSVYGAPPPQRPSGPGGPGMPQLGGGPGSAGSPMTAGGDLVQLQAPNGAVKAVRRALVPHYLQRGAKVVS